MYIYYFTVFKSLLNSTNKSELNRRNLNLELRCRSEVDIHGSATHHVLGL